MASQREPEVIANMRSAFITHVEERSFQQFVPPPGIGEAFSKLSRDLETKRQESSLTDREKEWLAGIDDIQEKISMFNHKSSVKPSQDSLWQEPHYDLNGKISEKSEETSPLVIPKLTHETAGQIIKNLDQQFEEKVMSKIKHSKNIMPTGLKADDAKDFQTSTPELVPEGRSLNDFLDTVRPKIPNVPFMDEDSNFDLSKMLTGRKSNE